MVGGFSESPMLQHAVKKEFGNLRVIVPREASSSILRGAVAFGHNPKSITQRVLTKTYGFDCLKEFQSDKHPKHLKIIDDAAQLMPHNLIKEKLLYLIEWTFKRALKNYGSLYLACNDRKAFFTSSDQIRYTLWSCQNVCDALSYLLDNIYIRFGTKLYRQIVGIPMGTNSDPLVADLFLYCYERDFMDFLNHDNQADVIEAFNSTSRYLDDLLNIDNPYFEGMVKQVYPPKLQMNKANNTYTETPF